MAKTKETGAFITPEEISIELRKPLTAAGGALITKLDLREPTGAEIDKFMREESKNGPMSATLMLIALVSGVDRPFIERIGIRDIKKAGDFLALFTADGPEIGS